MRKTYYLLLLFVSVVNAQIGAIDNSFNGPDNGTYRQLKSEGGSHPVLLPDGKIVIISPSDGNIFRLNTDGSIDTTFLFPGFEEDFATVNKLFLQPDGKILAASQFDGTMIRLNSDGSIDTSFISPDFTDFMGSEVGIGDIDFQADGKILVTGNFLNVNDTSQKRFARLNSNGTVDTTFNMGTGFSGATYSVAVQPDGKIIVVGTFSSYSTSSTNHIVRINPDGSVDTSFSLTSGTYFDTEGTPIGVEILPSGKILVNGSYDLYKYGTQTKEGLIRLNSNGSYDTTFNAQPFISSLITGTIDLIALQADGKIIINTGPGNYENNMNNYFRLTSTGELDTSFQSTLDYSGFIHKFIVQPDGKVIVGGNYYNAETGITRNSIHRANADGSFDLAFMPHTGTNNGIFRSFVQQDGMILLMGDFTTYNDQYTPHMARIDLSGNLDTSFTFDTAINMPLFIYGDPSPHMREQADGKILIASNDFTVNGVEKSIIRINNNGALDATFNCEIGLVQHFTVLPDGKIMAVGSGNSFLSDNGYKLLRLNTDGSIDPTYPAQTFDQPPLCVELLSDGKLLVGGAFATHNANPAYRLIKLNPDGTKDDSFAYTSPVNGPTQVIRTITQPDGQILISFVNTNTYTTSIARLNSDGTKDLSFLINFGSEYANEYTGFKHMILMEDGSILLKRFSGTFNFEPSPNLIKLNSDGTWDNTFDIEGGSPIAFYSLAGCDRLIATGEFGSIGTTFKHNIVAINASSNPLPPAAEQIQYFGNGQTLADLIIEGENIIWYSEPLECENTYHAPNTARTTNTNEVLPSDTPLVDGTIYYASQTVNGVESTFSVAIKAVYSATANVDEFTSTDITAYPNPTNGMLAVEAETTVQMVYVYNTLGQLILSRNVNAVHIEIDLSPYNTGVYIIKVTSDNGVNTLKVFKK